MSHFGMWWRSDWRSNGAQSFLAGGTVSSMVISDIATRALAWLRSGIGSV